MNFVRKKNGNGKKKNSRELIPKNIAEVNRLISDGVKWLDGLREKETYTQDWVNYIAEDILYKCMGLKSVVITNMFGQEAALRMFNPDKAIKALELICRINGVKIAPSIQVIDARQQQQNNFYNIQLQPTPEKTAQVFEILQAAGKFQVVEAE